MLPCLFKQKDMEQKELSMFLRDKAREAGLCDQWYGEWEDSTTEEELIDKYKRGFDFMLKTGFVSSDFIKRHFDKDLLHRNNIYISEDFEREMHGMCIITGNSKGVVNIPIVGFAEINVCEESDVEINVPLLSRVFVKVHNNANVKVVLRGKEAKCFVYQYGGHVEADEGVTVRDRSSFSYK